MKLNEVAGVMASRRFSAICHLGAISSNATQRVNSTGTLRLSIETNQIHQLLRFGPYHLQCTLIVKDSRIHADVHFQSTSVELAEQTF